MNIRKFYWTFSSEYDNGNFTDITVISSSYQDALNIINEMNLPGDCTTNVKLMTVIEVEQPDCTCKTFSHN